MMDLTLEGAEALGQEMTIEDALRRSHLSVTEPIREKVIRNEIKEKMSKRSKSLSLKPSSAPKTEPDGVKSQKDLEAATMERLSAIKW